MEPAAAVVAAKGDSDLKKEKALLPLLFSLSPLLLAELDDQNTDDDDGRPISPLLVPPLLLGGKSDDDPSPPSPLLLPLPLSAPRDDKDDDIGGDISRTRPLLMLRLLLLLLVYTWLDTKASTR